MSSVTSERLVHAHWVMCPNPDCRQPITGGECKLCPRVATGELHLCRPSGILVPLKHRVGIDKRCRYCMVLGLATPRSEKDLEFYKTHFPCVGCNIVRQKGKEGTFCRHCAALISEFPSEEGRIRKAHRIANEAMRPSHIAVATDKHTLMLSCFVASAPAATHAKTLSTRVKASSKKTGGEIPSLELEEHEAKRCLKPLPKS